MKEIYPVGGLAPVAPPGSTNDYALNIFNYNDIKKSFMHESHRFFVYNNVYLTAMEYYKICDGVVSSVTTCGTNSP